LTQRQNNDERSSAKQTRTFIWKWFIRKVNYLCSSVTLGFFFSTDKSFVGPCDFFDRQESSGRLSDFSDDVLEWLHENTALNSTSDCANSTGKSSLPAGSDNKKTQSLVLNGCLSLELAPSFQFNMKNVPFYTGDPLLSLSPVNR
jgi:hypothetical protein